MNINIPLFKTTWTEDDITAVSNVIKRGTFWADGPEIKDFEDQLKFYCGAKYAVAFNSGTSALLSLLLSYDLTGKEVICPSFTFIATSNAIVLAGGIPVFAESEQLTFGLDAEDVEKKITAKTGAIVTINYGGCVGRDVFRLKEIAKKYNLILIEDSAQTFGVTTGSQIAGTFGDASIFSFCQNKLITTGEGGVAITDSEKTYEKLKLIRSHGRVENKNENYFSSINDNEYLCLGYNFRLPTMLAALGISQLKNINSLINKRQYLASLYDKGLKNIKEIRLPCVPAGFNHAYQMYTILLESEKLRDLLQDFLMENNIQTKVYFNPVHLKSFYREKFDYAEGMLPKTEALSKKVLTLPLYPTLEERELDFIVERISYFFKNIYQQEKDNG